MTSAGKGSDLPKYLVLTGGVGGAKLCQGLAELLEPEQVLFVVNTGDDFQHLGLHISPDIDSLTYALSGLASVERGWGRDDETWNCLATLKTLEGDTWFQLGDRDLALHLKRSAELAAGHTLSEATKSITRALGISHRLVPMSDDAVPTLVDTHEGLLAFQEYFVRRRCEPRVKGLVYQGAQQAAPQKDIVPFLKQEGLRGIILCPSNPMLSIEPILAAGGIGELLKRSRAPVLAVSPIIDGAAVRGPTAKIFSELGQQASALAVAKRYGNLLDGFILDEMDQELGGEMTSLGLSAGAMATLMSSDEDKRRLAKAVLGHIDKRLPIVWPHA